MSFLPLHNIPSLNGYSRFELLYEGRCTSVFRALWEEEQRSVVIKFLRADFPRFSELVQFQNQYTIPQNLPISGIVSPLAFESCDNGFVLIMEDFGGISLEAYADKYELLWQDVCAIAIQLSDILHDLYKHRVIHKDIKPSNILIHPETKQLKLIDFGIASLLPRESQEIQSPGDLEGTLGYLAPEQTGRMNRGIDYRADFYALGVTLYELLTGELPFESKDTMELVHCHLAKDPMLPHAVNGHIPVQISEIVLKLMAKNAEDRYQSVLGLKHDLQQCLEQWETTGKILAFDLGQRDMGDRFLIPEKLYGREAEIQTLLDAFDRVSQGASELMLVAGNSGVGKTAVVNEIHKSITQNKGYFIQGKFDQLNRNIPFSAFVQAFRSLMRQLLGESDIAIGDWQAKILAAVGGQGQVLIEVIPELTLIIGPQPEVPELSGLAAQNRFNRLFGQFIRVFSSPDHPLTIFLDDLQWVDSASLKLLKLIMTQAKTGAGYLLVLGAYRDHEVFAAHPLMLTLNELNHRTIQTLTLEPLTANDIYQLVAESLHCSVEIAAPLAELVHQKTRGNPFFATQFLQGLQADGWITFNTNLGHWQCDLSQVRSLALTDDVVEFMVRRLQQWPHATQNALAIAACLGNQFDLDILSIICEQSPETLAQELWLALQAGLLIPDNETYKFFQTFDASPIHPPTSHDVTVTYRFLHDRVQQAAYAFIPEGEKQQTHARIGRFLLDHLSSEKQEDSLFDIVNQLNIGRDLVSNPDEQHQLILLNLKAGIKAKSATAYGAALSFFDIAIELLSADAWQQQYSLVLELHEHAAEVASLVGHGERMEALVQTVMTQAVTSLDTVKTLQVKMQYCLGQNQPLVSIEIARGLLEKLGVVLPESPTMEMVQHKLDTVNQLADQYSFDEIVALPTLTNPEKLAILSTLMLVTTSLMIADPNLFLLVGLMATQFSLEHGHSALSSYVYGMYAILLKNLEQNIDKAYGWGNIAVQLLHTPTPHLFENRVYHTLGAFVTHEKQHVEETLSVFQQAYINGVEDGDFEFSGYSIYLRGYNLYFLGRELSTVKQAIIQANEALSSIGQHLPIAWNQCFYQTVLELSGTADNVEPLPGDPFDDEGYVQSKQEQNDGFGLCYFYFNQATLGYLFGDYPQALEASTLAKQSLAGLSGMLTEVLVYFYDSLIRLACANGSEEAGELAKVRENQQKMKRWADNAPMNFQHKYELICAEEQRLLGDRLGAIDSYDRAIAGAKENSYLQEEALANELAAKFYLGWGKTKIAAVYMQEAFYCYERWGAKAKTNHLVKHYTDLLQPILEQKNQFDPLKTLHNIAPLNLSAHSSDSGGQSATGNLNVVLDLATLFKSAQTFSESINLNELLEKLTVIMLQTSGAERLVLLLPDADQTWQVRVSATTERAQLVADPLADYPHLPVRLIQYVLRTQEILALDGSASFPPVVDSYLQHLPHSSVLCLPLQHQRQLIGLLYLEHQSMTGVFGRDRITVLNFLCNQAAISLENALLNQALEEKLEIQTAKRQASESLFRNIVDNIPGVVYQLHITADGVVSVPYISSDCYGLYEVSAEAIMSGQCSLRDFEYDQDRSRIDQVNLEMSQSLQPWEQEFRIMTPSGTLKWVQVFNCPTSKPDGSTIWDGIVMDVSDRKATEFALQDAQSQFRRMTENVPGMIYRYVLHPDGNDELTYVSSQIQELFELEPDMALQNTEQVWRRIHPDDMSWLEDTIQESAKNLQSFTSAYRLILPEKGIRWVQNMSSVERLGNGDIAWDGIVQDITGIKQYEQQLTDLSVRLKLAIASNQIGIWEWNFQDHRLSWDQRMFEMYGIPPEMFEGTHQDWEKCIHPEDVEQALAREDDDYPVSKEFRIIRPDGSIRHIASSVILQYDDQGKPLRAVGTNIDISDRKAAEQELFLKQNHLEALLNNIPHLAWIKDAESRFIAVNQSFADAAGCSTADIPGKTDHEFWPPEIAQAYVNDDKKILKSGKRTVIEEPVVHANGIQGWLETTKTPFKNVKGEYIGTVGIAADISDRKQAEEELQRTNEELIRATRLKDEFLANMSHELRTPLNSILGLSEALQDQFFGPLTEKQMKFMKIIEESGKHLLSLINDILDVAKIESGQFDLDLTQTDINCLCESSLAFVRQEASKKNISITIEKLAEPSRLFLDERRMKQSLINLLNNAVKFTFEGGSVALKLSWHLQNENRDIIESNDLFTPEPSQDRLVWASGQIKTQRYISISVTDTGIGISPEQFTKLFKPFSQVESTLNRTYAGTGLGLVLVKQIAELHGGTVSVISEINKGSCFSINIPYEPILPLNQSSQGSDDISQLGLTPSDQTRNSSLILLADDNQKNLTMLVSYLENFGYRVITAEDGIKAIDLAQKHNPDLILMDIQMPELNGYEAIQRIRQNIRLKDTPIIALTALAMPGDQQRCLAAGANHYLSKPVPLKQLVLSIRKLLD